MIKIWSDKAWEDYLYWQEQDKKTLKRINRILRDIDRHAFEGIGKPEPLKHERQGYWSRRIDETNRLIYRIEKIVLKLPNAGPITTISRSRYASLHPRQT